MSNQECSASQQLIKQYKLRVAWELRDEGLPLPRRTLGDETASRSWYGFSIHDGEGYTFDQKQHTWRFRRRSKGWSWFGVMQIRQLTSFPPMHQNDGGVPLGL